MTSTDPQVLFPGTYQVSFGKYTYPWLVPEPSRPYQYALLVRVGPFRLSGKHPILLAGPCVKLNIRVRLCLVDRPIALGTAGRIHSTGKGALGNAESSIQGVSRLLVATAYDYGNQLPTQHT